MVRFSCFSNHSLYQRPKKVQQVSGKMHSTPKQNFEDQERQVQFDSASMKMVDNNFSSSSVEQTSPSSHGDCWKSEYLQGDLYIEDSKESLRLTRMKKSQSLGSILDKERDFSGVDVTQDDDDDGVNPQFSFKYSSEGGMERINESLDRNAYPESYDNENIGTNFDKQQKENELVEPFDMADNHGHHRSLFSIEGVEQFENSHQADIYEQSTGLLDDSGCLSSDNQHGFERSCSVTNHRGDTDNSTEGDRIHEMRRRSKSFGNLDSLSRGTTHFLDGDDLIAPEVTHIGVTADSDSYNLPQGSDEDRKGLPGQIALGEEHPLSDASGGLIVGEEAHGKFWAERFDYDHESSLAIYQSHDNLTLEGEKRESETDGDKIKNLLPESLIENCNELSPKEFNVRRIEQWLSQIDIENGSIVEEPGESSSSFSSQEPQAEVGASISKPDAKSCHGMEVAYNYISSMTVTSSSAQMVKLGLVAVPSLSAFTGLRVLNLSGNSIARITPGYLPRGLHLLNLSKNNIAIIEGLRDLTHLRILDLSYNRIVRIGHGLASCSSLKELYLGGNKISEVEGLHRLLKLNVLDLRGNKISTAKGLGQLAANYGSMHAINLDGNPAQRNVGDEHLKKHLLSLLPKLAYYNNKHAMKTSSTKEMADRPSRSASRTELKLPRRGSYGSNLNKSALSQVRTSHAAGSSVKQSRSRESYHARLPPMGSRPANYLQDTERKPVSLQSNNPIRRSRSEGAFELLRLAG